MRCNCFMCKDILRIQSVVIPHTVTPWERTWVKEPMASATVRVDCSYTTGMLHRSVFQLLQTLSTHNAIKTINFNEPVISRAAQLPGRTWQSTRSVNVVCCCLLTSLTALGDCHTIAALICPYLRLLTLGGLRDDTWQLRDGQVWAEFLKWHQQLEWISFPYCFPQTNLW